MNILCKHIFNFFSPKALFFKSLLYCTVPINIFWVLNKKKILGLFLLRCLLLPRLFTLLYLVVPGNPRIRICPVWRWWTWPACARSCRWWSCWAGTPATWTATSTTPSRWRPSRLGKKTKGIIEILYDALLIEYNGLLYCTVKLYHHRAQRKKTAEKVNGRFTFNFFMHKNVRKTKSVTLSFYYTVLIYCT